MLLCAFPVTSLAAQNPVQPPTGSSPDGEIVVTAQKRTQSIQDVGISIAAYSGEQLTRRGIIQSTDIVALTPGLSTGGNTGGQFQQFSIRGVTQNDVSDIVEPPNAVYIDEAYMPAAQTQVFGLFDIERVEVLRGPQGTLFGRNATGGLIHYITRKPTDYWDGFIDLTYGSYNQARVEAAIGGPIAEDLSFRVSGTYDRFDNILKNDYPKGQTSLPGFGLLAGSKTGASNFWNDNSWAFRAEALWKPGNAELLLSGFYAGSKVSSAPYQSQATTAVVDAQGRQVNSIKSKDDPLGCVTLLSTGGCVGGVRPVQGGDFYGYIDPDGSGLHTSSDFAGARLNRVSAYGATASLSWDLGATKLTAISHYVHSEKHLTLDVDASPTPVAVLNSGPTTTNSFTQELRLNGTSGRLTWVTGLYYLYNKVNYNVGFGFGPSSPITLQFVPGQIPTEGVASSNLRTNSYSGFGQLEYRLTNTLTVIGGARVIQDDQKFNYAAFTTLNTDDARLDFTPVLFQSRPSFADKRGETLWAGKLQLNYKPNSDLLIYAGVNRGSKAGSYNTQAVDSNPTLAPAQIPFKPEILIDYEAGLKATIMRGFVIDASAFYYDYSDYQAFSYTPGSISGFTSNKDARSLGFEVEAQLRPLDNLSITGGIGYIDAKVKNVGIAPGIIRDRKPAFTPDVQLSGSIRYEFPNLIAGGSVAVLASGNYASSTYYNLQNFDSQKLHAYAIGNLRVSWTSPNKNFEFAGFVNNFTDTRNEIQGFDLSSLCGCSEIAYGKPRWFGINLRAKLR